MSSNLIKWNYISLENNNKRVIDSDNSEKNPFPKQNNASGMSLDGEENSSAKEGEFKRGMNKVNYDEVFEKKRQELEAEKNFVLTEAQKLADTMVEQARIAGENIKNDAYESGLEAGREAGHAEAMQILETEKAKLAQIEAELRADYQSRIQSMEPLMADFMAKMIEKLTGVIVEDKEEIICHLIRTGLEQTGKSRQFIIRVSSEDYPVVEAQKKQFLTLMEGRGELIFQEDRGLKRNQCVIETDTAIIESSLDIQLKKLKEDIRMMALRIDE